MKIIKYTTNMVEFRDIYLVSPDGEKFKFTDTNDIDKCIKEATKAICGFLGKEGYEGNGLGLKKEEGDLYEEGKEENDPAVKKARNFEHSQIKKYLFTFEELVDKNWRPNCMRLQSKLVNSLIGAREEINR